MEAVMLLLFKCLSRSEEKYFDGWEADSCR
jgi:hypothetical protein